MATTSKKENNMSELTIFDGEQTRKMNEAELAQHALDLAEMQQRETDAIAKAKAKQALLDRLGITADEAQLLLS